MSPPCFHRHSARWSPGLWLSGALVCVLAAQGIAHAQEANPLRGGFSPEEEARTASALAAGPRVPVGAIPRPGEVVSSAAQAATPRPPVFGQVVSADPSFGPAVRRLPVTVEAPRRPFGPRDRTVSADPGFDPLPDLEAVTAEQGPAEPEVRRVTGRATAAEPVGPATDLQTGGIARNGASDDGTGIRLGVFVLRPAIEVGLTNTRSTAAIATGTPPTVRERDSERTFADVGLDATLSSDWVRHALTLRADVDYASRISGDGAPGLTAGAGAEARLDVTSGTTLTGTFDYAYRDEDTQIDVFDTGTGLGALSLRSHASASHALRGAVLFDRADGLVATQAELSVERTVFDTVVGVQAVTAATDFTELGVRLRGGIATGPIFTPYLEAELGQRLVDGDADADGLDRDATSVALRAGTQFALDERLSGEMSIGYVQERFEDASLANLGGISVAGAINWRPAEGTAFNAQLETDTTIGTEAGVSGAINYRADFGLTQTVRRDLVASLGLGFDHADQTGAADSTTVRGTIGLEQRINRSLSAFVRAGVSETWSSAVDGDASDRSIAIGLRAQR